LAAISVVGALLALEFGWRIATGVSPFKFADWRAEGVQINRLGERALFDPALGWTLRANHASAGHQTLDHGIRRNFQETALRTGQILAVGDSYTEGWEVSDGETWPAHLERLTGRAVLNGGVGGYGTDQIILRAEQLLPIVRPKVLIIGFLEFDIYRAAHSHFGAPKPYFTLENGALRYHPSAPLESKPRGGWLAWTGNQARAALGYSALASHLLSRLAPGYWYGPDGPEIRRADNDPVAVTCALLARVKQRTEREGIRLLLFMQHYALAIAESDQPSENARRVTECARGVGITVVDQFAPLRAVAAADANALWKYYVKKDEMFTHMSPAGNAHAAGLLAKALAQ
jgi:lysophospholipase L1-like esterase